MGSGAFSVRTEGNEVDLRPVEGADADIELAALTKALGHPARVRVFRLLRARESCSIGELVVELRLAQSTVSEHVRILREVGLVVSDGATRGEYTIDANRLRRLKALVGAL